MSQTKEGFGDKRTSEKRVISYHFSAGTRIREDLHELRIQESQPTGPDPQGYGTAEDCYLYLLPLLLGVTTATDQALMMYVISIRVWN